MSASNSPTPPPTEHRDANSLLTASSAKKIEAPLVGQSVKDGPCPVCAPAPPCVSVPGYRTRQSRLEYVVRCVVGEPQNQRAWRVHRRYQQFKNLDVLLRQLCAGLESSSLGALPPLPQSHWLEVTNQSSKLVERRRRCLETYLQQLLVPNNRFYTPRSPLFVFLHDGGEVELGTALLERQVPRVLGWMPVERPVMSQPQSSSLDDDVQDDGSCASHSSSVESQSATPVPLASTADITESRNSSVPPVAGADDDDVGRTAMATSSSTRGASTLSMNARQESRAVSPTAALTPPPPPTPPLFIMTVSDRHGPYQLLTQLGSGSFGRVFKVMDIRSSTVYAMKVLHRRTVAQRNMTAYVEEERRVLMALPPHRFVVRLHDTFQSEEHLHLVFHFLPGGELHRRLYAQPRRAMKLEEVRLYAAELVLALDHLHTHHVAHRDVKLENLLLDAQGHLCLTDFGLARLHMNTTRRRSFVGSPEYMAPEVVRGEVQTTAVDWWSFGVVLYELLTGGPSPFYTTKGRRAIYHEVLTKEVCLEAIAPEARPLVAGLLNRDPQQRLRTTAEVQASPFFDGVDWAEVLTAKESSPFQRPTRAISDCAHFSSAVVSQWAILPSAPAEVQVEQPHHDHSRMPSEPLDGFPAIHNHEEGLRPVGCDVCRHTLSLLPTLTDNLSPSPTPPFTSTSLVAAEMHNLFLLLRSQGPRCSPVAAHGEAVCETIHACLHSHAWQAVCIEMRSCDGRIMYPWGVEVEGMLIYHPHGSYTLQLLAGGRRVILPRTQHPVDDATTVHHEQTQQDTTPSLSSTSASHLLHTFISEFGSYQVHPLPSSLASSFMCGGEAFVGLARHTAKGSWWPWEGSEASHGKYLLRLLTSNNLHSDERTRSIFTLQLLSLPQHQRIGGETVLCQSVITFERVAENG